MSDGAIPEDAIEDDDSGPFCPHWFELGDHPCKECGHQCTAHGSDGDQSCERKDCCCKGFQP